MVVNELKREFRGKYPSSAIASYDWTDIESGTGVVNYIAGVVADSSASIYKLTTQSFKSNYGVNNTHQYASKSSDTNFTNPFELNFDTSVFNTPRTIRGKISVFIPFATFSAKIYCVVTLYKVSGSTETSIVTFTTQTYSGGNGVTTIGWLTSEASINSTNVKVGEFLRLEIKPYYRTETTGTTNMKICYNSENTATATTTDSFPATFPVGYSQLNCSIPYEIQIT